MELSNKHRKSNYYHPVTGMCYRKRTDGRFEYCTKKYFTRKDRWEISGMTTGFLPIPEN